SKVLPGSTPGDGVGPAATTCWSARLQRGAIPAGQVGRGRVSRAKELREHRVGVGRGGDGLVGQHALLQRLVVVGGGALRVARGLRIGVRVEGALFAAARPE